MILGSMNLISTALRINYTLQCNSYRNGSYSLIQLAGTAIGRVAGKLTRLNSKASTIALEMFTQRTVNNVHLNCNARGDHLSVFECEFDPSLVSQMSSHPIWMHC